MILLVTLGLSNSKSKSRVTLYFFRAVVQRVLKVEVFEVGEEGDSLRLRHANHIVNTNIVH